MGSYWLESWEDKARWWDCISSGIKKNDKKSTLGSLELNCNGVLIKSSLTLVSEIVWEFFLGVYIRNYVQVQCNFGSLYLSRGDNSKIILLKGNDSMQPFYAFGGRKKKRFDVLFCVCR